MDNEAYAEWLVKRKSPAYAMAIKAAMGALCAVGLFLALTTMLGIIALALAAGASYLVFRNLNIEFEYLYVTGQLSIDKIMGRSKRKKVWEASLEEIQIIAPADSYVLKDYETQGMKIMDFSSRDPQAKVFALISRKGSETVKILFEPNEKMLRCVRMTSPRKVIQ